MDIIILSNGPGEVTTWVLPVVKALRQQLGNDSDLIRISVILSPCPNATGKEAAIALSYSEVDRVQSPEYFWSFLLWGKTAQNWDWRAKGVVVFLGGDQFFTVVIGKRLGYRTVVYGEWEARWHSLIDSFGVMKAETMARVPQKYADKFTVVGDLMSDLPGDGLSVGGNVNREIADGLSVGGDSLPIAENLSISPETSPPTDNPSATKSPTHPLPDLIALFPGSKAAKLTQGLPLTLAIAEYISAAKPEIRFAIPVAPTLDLETLVSFANPQQNPLINKFGWASAELIIAENTDKLGSSKPETTSGASQFSKNRDYLLAPPFNKGGWGGENCGDFPVSLPKQAPLTTPVNSSLKIGDSSNYQKPFIKTSKGLFVELWQEFPAYHLLSQCQICLTTVGANTAELGSLGIPMIILLPTNQLDAMRSWDGLPGLLANLPGVGSIFAKLINWFVFQKVLRKGGLFAWPNIWAKSEIVPELVGKLQPEDVAKLVLDYLDNPEKLAKMRSRLRGVRGKPGAAQKLAQLVCEELV
ncbi:MAG TPA: lipid-A-disaccharide synthase [Cyanobacteria bacterium UBA11149]|nr:lipid-A-disaccharide synthase [Cyanobacteria bacterium UBA11367]HBE59097.1 lipid-A-disaccharide synthase [Cyanobacteria bacterium UBA11366]HBK64117.1 lipid-A-disaccharide synthase [Cyanobacteria bacterium UBA11166]HBR72777.1 lipid-A-disaccharide synthase [Cyanobacteria bacterium UBA11159]HBS67955.1 lipid-A-disaccharide synthase [Cyanobacteria bacterium UBA11153]HBW87475.1 lipid-A-disaccharide synthase [Cyanobacteria bacterium UBA11149]